MKLKVNAFGLVVLAALLAPEPAVSIAHAQLVKDMAEFAVDLKKCERFGLKVSDVTNPPRNGPVYGYPLAQMVEGEKIVNGQPASEPESRQLKAVFEVVLDKNKLAKFGLKPAHVNAALANSCLFIPTIDARPIKLAEDIATIVEIRLAEKEVPMAEDEAKKILGQFQSVVITSIDDRPIQLGDIAAIDIYRP